MLEPIIEKVSIAPMVSHTNAFARHFFYCLAPDLVSYSEMITATSLHYNPHQLTVLKFEQTLNPTVCQFASREVGELVEACQIAKKLGYSEINLNLGCPSKAIQKKKVGVCLMKEADLVAELYQKVQQQINLPLSIKCRTGVDDDFSYEDLAHFVNSLTHRGCTKIVLHARKAYLQGLNPRQNRTKPPLDLKSAQKLKRDFPQLKLIVNGEINSIENIEERLCWADGVMIGRKFIQEPLFTHKVQNHFFKTQSLDNFWENYFEFVKTIRTQQPELFKRAVIFMLKPLLNLAYGLYEAKNWRVLICEQMKNKCFDEELIYNEFNRIVLQTDRLRA